MRFTGACALAATLAAGAPSTAAVGRRAAMSIGAPNDGHLVGGVALPERPWLRVVPFYADADVRWGLPALVGLVERAGRRVARRFRGAVLGVGDLSLEHGGDIDRHASHESGRDVDLAFFLVHDDGVPVAAERFVPVAPDGSAPRLAHARFDDARNWALVQALIDDPVARVTHVFVAPHVRRRLLLWAARRGESPSVLARAAEVMHQPRSALEHDDHFHVRIGCPAGQSRTCQEGPTRRRRVAPHARTPRAALPTLPDAPSAPADARDEDDVEAPSSAPEER